MNAPLQVVLPTVLLLIGSYLFMNYARCGHLKTLADKPWLVAALVSWGIALFEYLLQVPANRIGFGGGMSPPGRPKGEYRRAQPERTAVSLAQLKIVQEVITLAVFVPVAILFMGEPLRLDYVWAGLCLVGAVYFIFRA